MPSVGRPPSERTRRALAKPLLRSSWSESNQFRGARAKPQSAHAHAQRTSTARGLCTTSAGSQACNKPVAMATVPCGLSCTKTTWLTTSSPRCDLRFVRCWIRKMHVHGPAAPTLVGIGNSSRRPPLLNWASRSRGHNVYTRFINGKMFPGDPLRDRFGGASSSSDMPDMHGFNNVCLITAFRNAGIPWPVRCDCRRQCHASPIRGANCESTAW